MRVICCIILFLNTFAQASMADILVPASLEDQSPREDVRKKIFLDQSQKRVCKIVSKSPSGEVLVDPGLTAVLQNLIKGITASDDEMLRPLFHPQIKVKTHQVKSALLSIAKITGKRPEASLFRAYGMNNLTGETGEILCEEDGLVVFPLYGHPLQVGAWIQVQGADEVARVYVVLIPSKTTWRIGAWHVQQWTHSGKDYVQWREEARDYIQKKNDLAGWLYLDITKKLLDGGKFLYFPVSKDIESDILKLNGSITPLELFSKKFTSEKLVYVSSLFSRKGASLLFRFQIPKEWSAHAIREHCRGKYKELSKESWMSAVAGIRCDYVFPHESIAKEGASGGIFIDSSN